MAQFSTHSMLIYLVLTLQVPLWVACQSTITINTPSTAVVGCPLLISWSGGTPPYFLSVLPGASPSDPNAPALITFGQQTGTSLTWVVDEQAGTSLLLELQDSQGLEALSAPFTVTQLEGSVFQVIAYDPRHSRYPPASNSCISQAVVTSESVNPIAASQSTTSTTFEITSQTTTSTADSTSTINPTSTTSQTTSSTADSASTASPTSTASHTPIGAIVGGIIGGVATIVIAFLICGRRSGRSRGNTSGDLPQFTSTSSRTNAVNMPTDPQLTSEQLDFIHTLHTANVPPAEIIAVMDRMRAARGQPESVPVEEPPLYDSDDD